MDFLWRNLDAAQSQAKLAAASAQGYALQISSQLSDQTRILAEQAGTLSKATAEHAQAKLMDLQLTESLNSAFQREQEAGPSEEELLKFSITVDFRDFVRSLTYSTFRDFPLADAIPPCRTSSASPSSGAEASTSSPSPDAKYLTPWQERHAMLVVLSVKEVNELRFVLCPKRMSDEQFWLVYFTLAKRYLPACAYDPDFVLPEAAAGEDAASLGFKQSLERLQKLSSTAKQWGSEAVATTRAAGVSVMAQSGLSPLRPPLGGSRPELSPVASEPSSSSRAGGAMKRIQSEDALAEDPDLEAYLQDVMQSNLQGAEADDEDDPEEEEDEDEEEELEESEEHEEAGGLGDAEEADGRGLAAEALEEVTGAAPPPEEGLQAGSGSRGDKEGEEEEEEDDEDFEQYFNEMNGAGAGGEAGSGDGEEGDEDEDDDLDLDEYMRDLQAEDKD